MSHPPPIQTRRPESASSLATARTQAQDGGVERTNTLSSIIKGNPHATAKCHLCRHTEIRNMGSVYSPYIPPEDRPGAFCSLGDMRIPDVFGVTLQDCPKLRPMDIVCDSCGCDLFYCAEDETYHCPTCGVVNLKGGEWC